MHYRCSHWRRCPEIARPVAVEHLFFFIQCIYEALVILSLQQCVVCDVHIDVKVHAKPVLTKEVSKGVIDFDFFIAGIHLAVGP